LLHHAISVPGAGPSHVLEVERLQPGLPRILEFTDKPDLRSGEPAQAGNQVSPPLGDISSQLPALAHKAKDGTHLPQR
jgi:hypothetical protein